MKVTYSAYQIDYFDKDLFEFYGFFPFNTDENKESKFFIKYTLIPPNSDLVDYMFDHYQSKKWQNYLMNDEKIYKYYENEGFQLEKIYDQETNELKEIKVQKNEASIQRASIWAIVFDLNHERPLLLLTNTDPGVDAFCNSVMLDQNCPSEIHLLLRDGLIKKVTLTAEVDADCNSLNGLEEDNQCPFDNDSAISC